MHEHGSPHYRPHNNENGNSDMSTITAPYVMPRHAVSARMETLYPGMTDVVGNFVTWCAAHDIDTSKILDDEAYDATVGAPDTDDAIEFHELSATLSDYLNDAQWFLTRPCPSVEHDYELLTAYLSHCPSFPDTRPTRVVFRSFTPNGDWTDPNGVIALMPDVNGGRGQLLSYMHHGQHGQASASLLDTLFRPYAPTRYEAGVRELEAIGYRVDVDRTPGGVTAPPPAPDPALHDAGNSHVILRNGDAEIHVRSSTAFNNRAYTFRGRNIAVPRGTVVVYNRAETGRTATIELQYPGNRAAGTGGTGRMIELGELPHEYATALVHELRRTTGTRDAVVYLVWSYSTVIHWHRVESNGTGVESDTSVTPPVRYTATTSVHQRLVNV